MLRRFIWRLLGGVPAQRKLDRRPYVVVRRDSRELWTKGDQAALAELMARPVWQKMLRFSDDAICQDVLAPDQDPDFVKALVAGRMRERDYQARLAKVELTPPVVDSERGYDPEREATTEDEKERLPYQDLEEESQNRKGVQT